MKLRISHQTTPIGPLGLAVDDRGQLRGVAFGDQEAMAVAAVQRVMAREYPLAERGEGPAPHELGAALDAYFGGDLDVLARIYWSLEGVQGSDGFQARVWRELALTAPGQTVSYGEMAKRVGEPGAAQATGVALNRNPIPLVLPCHRVVGTDGRMVGFGGGLERKTWLLRHEGALLI